MESRRRFFINYAKARGFEVLSPENWSSQYREELMATKVLLFPPTP